MGFLDRGQRCYKESQGFTLPNPWLFFWKFTARQWLGRQKNKPPRGPGGPRDLQGTEAPEVQDEAGAKDADSLMVKEVGGRSPYVLM